MSDKTVYYNGKDWSKAFNDKMNDMPKQKKYKGNVIHQQSMFVFEADGTRYEVVCPNGKIGKNSFHVYEEERGKIFTYNPQGGHVNKTNAETAVRLAIAHNNPLIK